MAKFLDTTGISYHLGQIIKNANERIVLISPYLKINDRIKELLEDKDSLKIDIRVIYGKNELQPEENNWLKSMKSIKTSFCKNLHAKCYMNEKESLITSMNLYEFSQANNNEMGIYVSKDTDQQLYTDIDIEAKRLIRISEKTKVTMEKVLQTNKSNSREQNQLINQNNGYCIRCQAPINLKPNAPFCIECYNEWKEDDDKYENFCHICGDMYETSRFEPACPACYKEYKNKLAFSA
jgi:hypothetical protein